MSLDLLLPALLLHASAISGDPPIPLEPAYHGAAVSGAGDVDLDGSSDVIVGAWWDDADGAKGSATVFSGKTGERLFVLRGDREPGLFGLSVAGGRDCNGDGTPDVVVGAPLQPTGGKATGAVHVYSGRGGKLLFRLDGRGDGDRFGWSVAMANDCDLDGYADVVVGAPLASTLKLARAGEVRLVSGKKGKPLHEWQGVAAEDRLGSSLDALQDADGDGASDVLAASWRGGYAWVLSGRTGKPLHELRAPRPDERFGWCARSAGDTNQSGFGDVLIGLPCGDSEGARLFDGKSGELRLAFTRKTETGEEGWGYGLALDGAGDVNADGFSDLIIGDPGCPAMLFDETGLPLGGLLAKVRDRVARPGRVHVHSGHDGKLLFELTGDAEDDRFGVSVAGIGDVDQDGFADVAVGAGPGAAWLARIHLGPKGEKGHTLLLAP